MLEFNKVEEIKKLIKSGFDLELISFELDIPINEVKKCKQDLEESNKSNVNKAKSKETNSKSSKPADSRMQQIKQRYEELFSKTDKTVQVKKKEKLNPKEIEIINKTLEEIKKIIEDMKQISRKEKYSHAINILSKIKKIETYPLTTEQLERLNTLMRF